ncbi:hypothetical protein [Gilliamella apicola]|uniref:hypothetical protein n=1 Tax=Gilliamella apicola TaxID=1196095 RepID=UPI003FA60FAA
MIDQIVDEKVVIPTLLLPIIVGEPMGNNVAETQPKRQRRTSRHLRMNGQRNKRRVRNTEQKQSPMPLPFAAASLELALGRVSIDYSQLKQEEPKMTTQVIPTLLVPVIIKDNEVVATNDIKDNTDMTLSDTSANQVNVDMQPDFEEVKQSNDSEKSVNVTEQTTGHSSAVMTKASAPEYEVSNESIKSREESDYHFDGKGNAGGLSAQDHAYAAASKPVISED